LLCTLRRGRHLPRRNTRYWAGATPYPGRTCTGWNSPAFLAHQTFVIALTPTAEVIPTGVSFKFSCANASPAPVTAGVNSLLFAGPAAPAADIVALVATATNDGIIDIPGSSGSSAFAVATVNLGAGDTISATADSGTVPLPVQISICQTNSTSGQCDASPASSVVATIDNGTTPTFGIFITGTDQIPFVPATNRIFIRFTDSSGYIRGATSVAIRTQ
jgi:hypothetical protein